MGCLVTYHSRAMQWRILNFVDVMSHDRLHNAFKKQQQGEEHFMLNIIRCRTWLADKLGQERGAGLAEYALLLFVVAVAAAGIIGIFGADIIAAFEEATDALPSDPTTPTTTGP